MKKWEYVLIGASAIFTSDRGALEEQLDQLGEDGWEVCGTIPSDSNGNATIILKRKKE